MRRRGARLLVCAQSSQHVVLYRHKTLFNNRAYCYASISSLIIKLYESTLNIARSIQSTLVSAVTLPGLCVSGTWRRVTPGTPWAPTSPNTPTDPRHTGQGLISSLSPGVCRSARARGRAALPGLPAARSSLLTEK